MPLDKVADYYALLAVPRDASLEEITKSWRKLVLLHHPDKLLRQVSDADGNSIPRRSQLVDEVNVEAGEHRPLIGGEAAAAAGRRQGGGVDVGLLNEARWVLSDPVRRAQWEEEFERGKSPLSESRTSSRPYLIWAYR